MSTRSAVTRFAFATVALLLVACGGDKAPATNTAEGGAPSPAAAPSNVPKPTGTHAHHIVGAATDIGKDLQRRLRNNFGIDLNSPMNGVFLPGCGSSKAIGEELKNMFL